MKCAQLRLNDNTLYTTPIDDLPDLLKELNEEHIGAEWAVSLIDMSEEEYNSLPEFEA